MYSLPSTSQTRHPSPRAMKGGYGVQPARTPRALLPTPAGRTRSARAKSAAERSPGASSRSWLTTTEYTLHTQYVRPRFRTLPALATRPVSWNLDAGMTTPPHSDSLVRSHGPPLLVAAIVVDFDGTACDDDVSYRLFEAFGSPGWRELDDAFEREEIGSRACLLGQAVLLNRDDREMLAYALGRFGVADTFGPFVRWARGLDVAVAVASDGLGFHVEPLLEAAGLGDVPVFTNRVSVRSGTAAFAFPNEHPVCRTCGTCKMAVVQRHRERGPVAFVGDGFSDRLGALYSDVVFATRHLADYCTDRGVPFIPWTTFDDVRSSLQGLERLPGPVETEPFRCPGWYAGPGSR